MGLFDIINPLSQIEKVMDMVDDLSGCDTDDIAEKLMAKPFRPGASILNAIDLINPAEHREAVYGDVIGIKRKLGYKHFGVYIGKGRVIHYASPDGDFGGTNTIHETTMSKFLGSDDEYFILEFPAVYGSPKEVNTKMSERIVQDILNMKPSMAKTIRFLKNSGDYHLYSPKETVRRAKSRIGESDYNLATNNC